MKPENKDIKLKENGKEFKKFSVFEALIIKLFMRWIIPLDSFNIFISDPCQGRLEYRVPTCALLELQLLFIGS
jgi:hypothetical protein